MIALQAVALVTVAIVGVVVLISAGSGSDSQKAPIGEIADPAPGARVKQAPPVSTRVRRREPRDTAKPHLRKASTETQAQDTPERSAESTPEYVPPPAPEYIPRSPAAAPPTTATPPATEFGL